MRLSVYTLVLGWTMFIYMVGYLMGFSHGPKLMEGIEIHPEYKNGGGK